MNKVKIEIDENHEGDIEIEYSRSGGGKYIFIKNRKFFFSSGLFAVLCHVCAHCFIEYHRMDWFEKEPYGKQIDIMAILLGFSKYLIGDY